MWQRTRKIERGAMIKMKCRLLPKTVLLSMQYTEMQIENDQIFPGAPVHQHSQLPFSTNVDFEPLKSHPETERWQKKQFLHCSGMK